MTRERRESLLEIAFKILSDIHSDLCHNGKPDQALEVLGVMRQVTLVSKKINGKE